MKCQNCNSKDANVHITRITNGIKIEMHLCDNCAKSNQEVGVNGIGFGFPMSFQNIVDGLFEVIGSPGQIINNVNKCTVCGMTFEEFRNNGRVGCSNCYNAFVSSMLPLIKRIHGNIQHTGKVPMRTGGLIKARRDAVKLKEELKNAVVQEEYEKAAEIRDKIRDLEIELNSSESRGEDNGE